MTAPKRKLVGGQPKKPAHRNTVEIRFRITPAEADLIDKLRVPGESRTDWFRRRLRNAWDIHRKRKKIDG